MCDLSLWHEDDPKENGIFITREFSISNGGDIDINKRKFQNGKWIGLIQDAYDEYQYVKQWIEPENYKKFKQNAKFTNCKK